MRHTGAPERNSKLQFCYHSRPQIFVLIPHARSAHHARSASNKMNDPETSSTRPRKTENWKETIAVESKTTATRPRTIRPLVSMLRVKYLFMMFERSFETTPVFFFFGTQRSFPDLAARTTIYQRADLIAIQPILEHLLVSLDRGLKCLDQRTALHFEVPSSVLSES